MKYFKHDLKARQNQKLWKFIKTHGMTGYGIWWSLLEVIYEAEDKGFQVSADELWLERFADELRVSDSRVLTRILDTLAELNLIDMQLWQEHIIFVPGIIERGDSYIQQKAKNRDRVKKHREKQKTSHVSNELQSPCNQLQPPCNAPVTTNIDPDPDPDPDSDSDSNSHSQKEDTEFGAKKISGSFNPNKLSDIHNQPIDEASANFSSPPPTDCGQKSNPVTSYFKKAKHPSQLMEDRFRRVAKLEEWEVAINRPNQLFIDWIVAHNKQGSSALPPKTMAARMLYNSRDQDTNLAALMWQEYQESRQQQQVSQQPDLHTLSASDIDALRKEQIR